MKYLILCITLLLSSNAFAFSDTSAAKDAGVGGNSETDTLYCKFGDISYAWIVGNDGVTAIHQYDNNSGRWYVIDFDNGSDTTITYAHCMHHDTNKGGFFKQQ